MKKNGMTAKEIDKSLYDSFCDGCEDEGSCSGCIVWNIIKAAQQERAPDLANGCPFCGVSAEDIADYIRLVPQEPPSG